MYMLCLCFVSVHIDDDDEDEEMTNGYAPASHCLANSLGVSSRNMQVMKASFFGDDDDMDTAAPPRKLNPFMPVVSKTTQLFLVISLTKANFRKYLQEKF